MPAATGAEALTRVHEQAPAAVVIDGDPPDMPAFELCRQLTANAGATPLEAPAAPSVSEIGRATRHAN